MIILANDGIAQQGIDQLEAAGFKVLQTKVAQRQLANYINQQNVSILLVRSATQVDKALIDACPNLKLIGRGGVGLDNIAVDYAQSKGIQVINTPEASVRSVAELVFAHLLGAVRHLQLANREMPLEGEANFKLLKKQFVGNEIKGKTLGIIGFGRIGQEVARMAIALGMNVIVRKDKAGKLPLEINIQNQTLTVQVDSAPLDELLPVADFISLHTPATDKPIIGEREIKLMKDGAGIINTARGGVIDEAEVDEAIGDHKLGFAALDVFADEPHPPVKLLMNPGISLSPHIGGSTHEAQANIGLELAKKISAIFN